MKNLVFLNTIYNNQYSIDSWKQWCDNNGCELFTDNGSNWNGRADGNGSVSRPTSNNYYTQVACQAIVDVTDTSNCKSSLQVYHQESNSITYGNTNGQTTGVTFIRLGDT